MTKTPSIKTADLDQYEHLDLHQLEDQLKQLQQSPPSDNNLSVARAIRQALRQRQRSIKAKVMEFEQINNHHLLIFDSTDNFSKIAGHSVLFYTLTIAARIHRRYSVKNDTDGYSRSEDGIVSIRARNQLELQLAEINIFPDHERSSSELHFYKLPKVYRDEQIAKLRDQSRQDEERIKSILLPFSPAPELYNIILELNRLLYANCRRMPNSLARETLAPTILLEANEMLVSYLNFANAKNNTGIVHAYPDLAHTTSQTTTKPQSVQAQNLFNLLIYTRNLRNNLANIENLRLMHQRALCQILEKLVEIERITAREYAKQLRKDQNTKA